MPISTDQARFAIYGLQEQLSEFETQQDEVKLDAFTRKAEMVIRQVFDPQSQYLTDLRKISFYPVNLGDSDPEIDRQAWTLGWNKAKNLLDTMLDEIGMIEWSLLQTNQSTTAKPSPQTDEVFIVHGHDEAMKQATARVLQQLGLKPLILHEQASQGRTLIEKLSDHTNVSFGVVLLSPDDMGYSKKAGLGTAKSRARQNVVFELGLLTGKLGRKAVAVLYPPSPDFEMPTDYQGVAYISYDEPGRWQYDLIRELQAFGFPVSADSLTRPS